MTLSCLTSDIPPVEVHGAVKADGSFKINLASAAGKALTCNILDASSAVVASLELQNSAATDMSGNPQVNGAPAFGAGNALLGNVTLDLKSGIASVPQSQITGAALVSGITGTPFDPTGNWQIADVDFTLPSGVGGTCAQGDNNCNGPPAGALLYFNRLQSVNVSDSSTV